MQTIVEYYDRLRPIVSKFCQRSVRYLSPVPISVWFLVSALFLFLFIQLNFEYYSYNPLFSYLVKLDFGKLLSVIDPFDFLMRMLLNLLILFALHALIYSLSGRSLTTIVLTAVIVLLLHQANHTKFIHLRDALSVQNFLYIDQLPEVLKHGYQPSLGFILLIIASFIVLPILQKRFDTIPLQNRFKWGLVSFSILSLFFIPKINVAAGKVFRLEKNYYSAALSMKNNGFFAALASDVTRTVNRKQNRIPVAYSKSEIERILKPFQRRQNLPASTRPVKIIIYLMESFWDPTRYKELGLKVDPIPEFHALQRKSVFAGEMISPTFGGFTVQAEFEVITGLSAHLGVDAAYRTIDKPAYSLASYITQVRPTTNLFVTSHNAWFWDRSRILPRLGFNILKEQTDFTCKDFKGSWNCPSEECLIQEATQFIKTEIPKGHSSVILLNGVQNHGPYEKQYQPIDFQVSSSLTELDQSRLKTNLNHLSELSKALKKLTDHYRRQKQPTIIIAFGDHLPGGYDFFESQSTEKLHRTPFLIWSNQSNQKSTKRNLSIGAHYLPHLALQTAGIESLALHRYMIHLSRRVPVITTELASQAKQQLIKEEELLQEQELDQENQSITLNKNLNFATNSNKNRKFIPAISLIRDYAILQYDLLHGEKYALQIK